MKWDKQKHPLLFFGGASKDIHKGANFYSLPLAGGNGRSLCISSCSEQLKRLEASHRLLFHEAFFIFVTFCS